MIAVKCRAGWEIDRGRGLLYMRFSRRENQILLLPLFVTSAETLRVIIQGGENLDRTAIESDSTGDHTTSLLSLCFVTFDAQLRLILVYQVLLAEFGRSLGATTG